MPESFCFLPVFSFAEFFSYFMRWLQRAATHTPMENKKTDCGGIAPHWLGAAKLKADNGSSERS